MDRREFLKQGAVLGTSVRLSTKAIAAQETPTSGPLFRAGFAERDITPAVGMEKPGGYGKAYHRQFHDPCKVRVAVFDDGAARVALVGIDALMVSRNLVEAARKAIQEKCGIVPHHVLIGASHSHSSGPTGMIQPGEYDQAPPDRKSTRLNSSHLGISYAVFCLKKKTTHNNSTHFLGSSDALRPTERNQAHKANQGAKMGRRSGRKVARRWERSAASPRRIPGAD